MIAPVKRKSRRRRVDANLVNELENMHLCAVDANVCWTGLWQMFYEHPWFMRRLNYSIRFLIKKYNLPRHCHDDLSQEAMLVFARALQRDVSLGFVSCEEGSYGAFLSTIIHRCCSKSLKFFFDQPKRIDLDESSHPFVDHANELSDHIDLEECVRRLPEPYRLTASLICQGKSIPQVARKTKRSVRTIYRWLDTATNLLRDALDLDDQRD